MLDVKYISNQILFSEQRTRSTGMDKTHIAALRDFSLLDMIQQAREALASINCIGKDSLTLCQITDGRNSFRGGVTVILAIVVRINVDLATNPLVGGGLNIQRFQGQLNATCLLYTSDAADEL